MHLSYALLLLSSDKLTTAPIPLLIPVAAGGRSGGGEPGVSHAGQPGAGAGAVPHAAPGGHAGLGAGSAGGRSAAAAPGRAQNHCVPTLEVSWPVSSTRCTNDAEVVGCVGISGWRRPQWCGIGQDRAELWWSCELLKGKVFDSCFAMLARVCVKAMSCNSTHHRDFRTKPPVDITVT